MHPGEMLSEYLKPMGVGQVEAAWGLSLSFNRLNEIVSGKRGITADTALRLATLLKTSPQLWMRLQADWDLHQAMQRAAHKGVLKRRLALYLFCTRYSGFSWFWRFERFKSGLNH